jgi:hypothetical protein
VPSTCWKSSLDSANQLRFMVPEGEVVNFGPYWEGTFDEGGHIYTLSVFLGQDGKSIAKQALSTMVPVGES